MKKSIYNAILSGKFSSDRTVKQYAEQIWKIEPVHIPDPSNEEEGKQVYNLHKTYSKDEIQRVGSGNDLFNSGQEE